MNAAFFLNAAVFFVCDYFMFLSLLLLLLSLALIICYFVMFNVYFEGHMLENCKRLICSPSLNKVYCIVLYCIVCMAFQLMIYTTCRF